MSSTIASNCYIPDMEPDITAGEWLEDRLKERGWSHTAFGDAVGVDRTTVGSWVNNGSRPHRRRCYRIAKLLDRDPNEILMRFRYPPDDPYFEIPEECEESIKVADEPAAYRTDLPDDKLIDAIIELARELERRKSERD